MSDDDSPDAESVYDVDAAPEEKSRWWYVGGGILFVFFAMAPLFVSNFHRSILFLMLMWAGLATAWNLLGGYAGYVSFGHAAFFGIGGFTVALSQDYFDIGTTFGWEMIVVLLFAGLVPMVIALLFAYPLLRLSGGYFAIAMLGLFLAFRELFISVDALGGGIGVAITLTEPDGFNGDIALYYLMGITVLAVVLVAHFIRRTRVGYGLFAIRENENAAKSLAIPTLRYKTIAFAISAFFPGVIGGIYVYNLAYITAGSLFNLIYTINMIVFAIIGGLGTVAGPIIGAILMVYSEHILFSGFVFVHLFMIGLLIVVVMLFAPDGIVGIVEDTSIDDIKAKYEELRRDGVREVVVDALTRIRR